MKHNDLDLKNWKELDINVDSLWLIGERDKSGKHSNIYHGNFIPQIPNQLIKRYTKKQDIVLDSFVGSGTTLFECEKLNRKFIGFDINGISYDQKVAKSPTNEFKRDFGENWKEYAIQNPSKVAEYLYKYQDEGRFGADSRLLVVYLDESVSIEKIANIIENTDLENPSEINFEYTHNKGKPTEKIKNYKVNCFIILLTN